MFLRGEGKAAYRLLAAEVDGEGLRGLVGYLPSLLDQPEPFLQDSSLFSVQDGYRFQFAVSHQERCFIFGRACRWFRSVCCIVDLETCVQVLGNVLAVRFPAEFLCHRFDGNQAVYASLCAQPGRTGFVVMGGDGADGGCQAGFEYADPYLVRRDIRETQDSFVADVGGMGDLFPSSVDPGIHGVSFHPFPVGGNRFLENQTVEGDRSGSGDDDSRPVLIGRHIGVCILVEHLFRAFCLTEQVGPVGFPDSLAGFFQYGYIRRREFSVPVGRDVQQESGVASYGAFIDVEHIVGASYFLVRIVSVEPAFADGSVGFGLLVMQVFGFIELFTASEVFVRHIGEVRHRVRICLVGDHVPFGRPCAAGFIAAPPDIFPSEDNGIGGKCLDQFFPGGIVVGLSAFPLGMCPVEPYFVDRAVFGQDLEELVEEVFVVVVHYEFETGLVGKRPSGDFPRDGPFGVWAEVAVQPFRVFDMVQVCR